MTLKFDASGRVDRSAWYSEWPPFVHTREVDSLADALDECVAEMHNVVKATRFVGNCFDDDTAFADWAQSRLRHALHKIGVEP